MCVCVCVCSRGLPPWEPQHERASCRGCVVMGVGCVGLVQGEAADRPGNPAQLPWPWGSGLQTPLAEGFQTWSLCRLKVRPAKARLSQGRLPGGRLCQCHRHMPMSHSAAMVPRASAYPGPCPQYGWDFPEKIPEKLWKDPGNALRAFPEIPLESTAGMPQTL